MKPRGSARLLFPALRWQDATGYEHEELRIEQALRQGVGGFVIFGGTTDAVQELTWRTQSRCDHALLFASDLERGAGQQFRGATALPPLAALGSLADLAATSRAAQLTAREALALGINWLIAPVADIDLEPLNPIVGTRAFGEEPEVVAQHVGEWIRAAQGEGAIACAKHFPGHGRTVADSHVQLPAVSAHPAELELDLAPFRAAIAAGVHSMMTAHVVYAALDAQEPATLSSRVIAGLLRGELGFEGVIATDALNMQALLDAVRGDEARAGLAALRAGCDALLYPEDLTAVGDAVAAEYGRSLPRAAVERSVERVSALADRCPPRWGAAEDDGAAEWALTLASRTIVRVTGQPACPPGFELLIVDDDLGGPYAAPPRDSFGAALQALGLVHTPVREPTGTRALVIAAFSDVRAWKAAGLSPRAQAEIAGALARRADATVVLFGHPRLAERVPAHNVVAAWGGEPVMQRAAARWLESNARRTVL